MAKSVEPEIFETEVLQKAKNIFASMKGESFEPDISQVDLYKKAQELERKSRDFYEEKSNEVETSIQREILLKIAEEEKKHYFLLENIINFVSRPQTWLENAEFNHLDEY